MPQIALLFLLVTMLEDSGYLARVAFVIDRLMGGVGLHGKAFVPYLRKYPQSLYGGGQSSRRDPDSFADLSYHSQTCFGFVDMDGRYHYARYRLINVDWDGIDDSGWGEREADRLEKAMKQGASGVKIFKALGLKARMKGANCGGEWFADSNDFTLVGLLFCGTWQQNSTSAGFFLFVATNDHAVVQRTDFHVCNSPK